MTLDTTIFTAVQSMTGNAIIDQSMLYAAELLILAVPLSLIYLWFRGQEGKEDSIYAFATSLTGLAVSYGMGLFYHHKSPFTMYDTLVTGSAAENAFPSQHATLMLAVAAGFYLRGHKKLGSSLLGLGIITGFARIYVGEHFPLDIAGAGVAAVLALGIIYFVEDRTEPIVSQVSGFFQDIEDQILERVETAT
ncbi:MAG: phosphatase PAP2 family protein [Candidatus Nanohaloarchaeota archaeon QJJ-7]|nr:phosphatase PAP2 family protein [Candidatus Nanohaloarchaeota archaeon QJJ-7]